MTTTVKKQEYMASKMDSETKKYLALKTLTQKQTITDLAKQNKVSRQFIHAQKNKLLQVVDYGFSESGEDQEKLLFNLPITKEWIEQYVISLVLDCRSTFRGVMKSMRNLLDYKISLGTISNIVKEAIRKAMKINANQVLKNVTHGTHDELFHQNKPVLAGIDIPSLYCYLLRHEEKRDGETWGIHLLDLQSQGFNPDCVFADDADGISSGHAIAIPHVPLHLDNFHLIKE